MYAKEILENEKGILIPFRNSRAIASAVIDLCKNPEKKLRIEKEALKFGKLMAWPNIALQHFQLFNRILGKNSGV
ncbi:MAG: hypothetical protein U9O59_03315 [Actinomycetota bacterium]|nr:hypothetical protein [Actinomycetota bacterium]